MRTRASWRRTRSGGRKSTYPAPTLTGHGRAVLLLIICGLSWSTGGLLIKLVDWPAGAIWSVRCAVAGLALIAVRRPSLRGISRAEWGAAVALAATTGLFILSNKLTTAANAILIQYSAPIWVALLGAWFLGERATRLDWITIVLVLGGIALFFFEQLTIDHVAGNLVAVGSGVAFAFSAMTLRKVAVANVDPLRPMILGQLLGAAIGAPFAFTAGPPSATSWLALIALGVGQQAVAYLCYAAAIKHATALEALLIPIIEPVLSPLWVALAFGELPGPLALTGGAIVVGSVALRGALDSRRAVRQ